MVSSSDLVKLGRWMLRLHGDATENAQEAVQAAAYARVQRESVERDVIRLNDEPSRVTS